MFKPTKYAQLKYYHYPTGPEPAVPYYDRGDNGSFNFHSSYGLGVLILMLLLAALAFNLRQTSFPCCRKAVVLKTRWTTKRC
jgi:hypothetical protein